MADEAIATQTAEGGAEGTASQGTSSAEQSDNSNQGAVSETVKVDSDNQQRHQTDTRPASHFYQNREVTRLKRELESLKQMVQQNNSVPAKPQTSELSVDKFWADPLAVMKQMLDDYDKNLPNKFKGTLEEYQSEMKRKEEEAYVDKLLDPNGELRRKDPQVLDRLEKLIEDNPHINDFSKVNFRAALEMALSLDKAMNQRPSGTPLAGKKTASQSTVSGVSSSSSGESSLSALREKSNKLVEQMQANPALKYNAEHRKKVDEVKAQITKMIEDMQKG